MLAKLLDASGQSRDDITQLLPQLSGKARDMVETVLHVQSVLKEIWPDLPVTFDLLDRRDGDYHQGLHFAISAMVCAARLPEAAPIRQAMAKMPQAYHLYGTCLARTATN